VSLGAGLIGTLTARSAESGPNVQAGTTTTVWNTKEPRWGAGEAFHLCVYDADQVVKVVLAHNMDGGVSQSLLRIQ